jgi:peptidyl-prolyl cis-trans isomerase C/foldase protein PrsA
MTTVTSARTTTRKTSRPTSAAFRGAARVRSPRWWAAGIVVTGLLASACPADPRRDTRVPIATVGDVTLDEARILPVLAQRGVARVVDGAARQAVTARIVADLVDEELLLQAAARGGVTISAEAVDREVRARAEGYSPGTFQRVLTAEQLTVDAYREGVRRRLVVDQFLRRHFATLPAVTDADVAARYAASSAAMQRPPEVRVRQVLVRTAEEARHLRGEIADGRLSVEDAARRFSTGLEAENGGDLGWFAQGGMPPAFDVCFALDKGAISDVVASDYGFHIFQILDTRPARVEPLAAVRDHLVDEIVRERQSTAAAALLDELRRASPVAMADDGIDRLVALLPVAPVTPAEVIEQGGHALDSHADGVAALPTLRRGTQ